MQRKTIVCLALAAACASHGLSGGSQGQSLPGRFGKVTGSVYCADNNTPARLALVTLEPVPEKPSPGRSKRRTQGQMNPAATTNMNGEFQIDGVAPGSYYVVPYLSGYISPVALLPEHPGEDEAGAKEAMDRNATVVEVEVNRTANVQVRLERAGSIAGVVTYDDGSPAIGLQIAVRRKRADSQSDAIHASLDGLQGVLSHPSTTDDRGRYRIASLPPGVYIVSASTPAVKTVGLGSLLGGGGVSLTAEPGNQLSVYTGSVFREKDAVPISIGPSQEVSGEDIVVPLSRLYSIRGSVVSLADNRRVGSGLVELLYSDDRSRARSTAVQPDGSFVFDNVGTGSYIVRVTQAAESTIGGAATASVYGPAEQSLALDGNQMSLVIQVPDLPAPTSGAQQ